MLVFAAEWSIGTTWAQEHESTSIMASENFGQSSVQSGRAKQWVSECEWRNCQGLAACSPGQPWHTYHDQFQRVHPLSTIGKQKCSSLQQALFSLMLIIPCQHALENCVLAHAAVLNPISRTLYSSSAAAPITLVSRNHWCNKNGVSPSLPLPLSPKHSAMATDHTRRHPPWHIWWPQGTVTGSNMCCWPQAVEC